MPEILVYGFLCSLHLQFIMILTSKVIHVIYYTNFMILQSGSCNPDTEDEAST